ncbi:unnamed protein product, partial [Pylaiella littoralis]
ARCSGQVHQLDPGQLRALGAEGDRAEQGAGRDVGKGGVGQHLGADHPLVLQGLRSHPQPRRKRGPRVVHLHVRRQLPRGSSRAARGVGASARHRARTAPATGHPYRRRR